jgi:hypothetical protein
MVWLQWVDLMLSLGKTPPPFLAGLNGADHGGFEQDQALLTGSGHGSTPSARRIAVRSSARPFW